MNNIDTKTDKFKHSKVIGSPRIGANLKEIRTSIGWSQAEMGEKVDITGAAISKIENGKTIPSLPVIISLCYLLNITIEELIGIPPMRTYQTLKFAEINNLNKADQKLILLLVERLNRK